MNLSPTNRNSPKEKRTFTFFRSRTLSSSSTDSNGGQSTSPRISPRSLFDKVRKRSQSDVKTPPPIDPGPSGPNGSNQNIYQQQQQQQQQLHQQHQQLLLLKKSINGNSVRKHLSHSISEENDEAISNEYINNSNNQNGNLKIKNGDHHDSLFSQVVLGVIFLILNFSRISKLKFTSDLIEI